MVENEECQTIDSWFNWKRFLRVPLWMLFLLVIPFAIIARNVSQPPSMFYSETRAEIFDSGDIFLDFKKDTQGVRLQHRQKVDDTYSSLGVSFYCGTPSYLPKSKTKTPRCEFHILGEDEGPKDEGSEIGPANRKPGTTHPRNYVSSSVLQLKNLAGLPDGMTSRVICPVTYKMAFDRHQPYRFSGILTVHFHAPNDPKVTRGVYRVGFYPYRLGRDGVVEVRCYSTKGQFLARQSNINSGCTFMGIKSDVKIGWIEIEQLMDGEGSGIAGLSFGD